MIGISLLLLPCATSAQETPALRPGAWAVLGPAPAPAAPATGDDAFGIERRLRRGLGAEAWAELREDYAAARGREKRTLRWLQCDDEWNLPPEGGAGLDSIEFDLNTLLGLAAPANEAVAAYLYRSIVAAEAGEIPIRLGSDDGVRLWLNGELLLDRGLARGLDVDSDRLELPLRAGLNHLLVKVVNVGGAWKFRMRQPRRVEQKRINEAIERGTAWLLAQQLIDGSWAHQQGEYRNGTTALALYTLLKSGVSPRHPAVLQAIAYLQAAPAGKTYAAGCQLMAAAALKDPAQLWWAEETAGDLLSWQERSGGWSYPGVHEDLSLTQYAALGLRAATQLGIEIPPEAWNDMAEFALQHQESWRSVEKEPAAGFRYRLDHGFTGSMTTAGISILSICRSQLGDRIKPTIRRECEAALAAGAHWLDRNILLTANPGEGAGWHHYYLYGLERCGALLGAETFGGIEWYWEGADWLLGAQGGAGEWSDPWGWSQRNTCFALLFLERATARATTQPDAHDPGASRLVSSDPAASEVQLKLVRQTPAVFWIECDRSDVVRVEYFVRPAGGEWTAVLDSEERRFAGRWTFPRPGEWEARAEAVLADGRRIVSGVVKFRHEEGIGDERLAYATDAQRNRLPAALPQAAASSGAPDAAVDNYFGTRWLCAADDADPWIEIRMRRSVRCAELRLTHARTSDAECDPLESCPRATRVEILFEKDGEPLLVEVDPDPRTKTVVRFDEPRRVSYLRVRVLDAVGGALGSSALGFAELELHEGR